MSKKSEKLKSLYLNREFNNAYRYMIRFFAKPKLDPDGYQLAKEIFLPEMLDQMINLACQKESSTIQYGFAVYLYKHKHYDHAFQLLQNVKHPQAKKLIQRIYKDTNDKKLKNTIKTHVTSQLSLEKSPEKHVVVTTEKASVQKTKSSSIDASTKSFDNVIVPDTFECHYCQESLDLSASEFHKWIYIDSVSKKVPICNFCEMKAECSLCGSLDRVGFLYMEDNTLRICPKCRQKVTDDSGEILAVAEKKLKQRIVHANQLTDDWVKSYVTNNKEEIDSFYKGLKCNSCEKSIDPTNVTSVHNSSAQFFMSDHVWVYKDKMAKQFLYCNHCAGAQIDFECVYCGAPKESSELSILVHNELGEIPFCKKCVRKVADHTSLNGIKPEIQEELFERQVETVKSAQQLIQSANRQEMVGVVKNLPLIVIGLAGGLLGDIGAASLVVLGVFGIIINVFNIATGGLSLGALFDLAIVIGMYVVGELSFRYELLRLFAGNLFAGVWILRLIMVPSERIGTIVWAVIIAFGANYVAELIRGGLSPVGALLSIFVDTLEAIPTETKEQEQQRLKEEEEYRAEQHRTQRMMENRSKYR